MYIDEVERRNGDMTLQRDISFTYAMPVILVLNGYASGIPGISVGSVVMAIYIAFAMYRYMKDNLLIDGFFIWTMLLLLLFGFISCCDYIAYGIASIRAIISTSLKMLIWFLGITVTTKSMFSYRLFKPFYRKFSIFSTIYLYCQVFSWNTVHIYLPNILSVGPIRPLYEQYSAEAYTKYLTALGFGRFSSFFSEPAYYGILMIIDLIIILLDSNEEVEQRNANLLEVLFIVGGIWLSTSTAAIIFAIFVLLVYGVRSRVSVKLGMLLLFVCVWLGGTVLFSENSLVDFFIEKATTIGSSGRIGRSYSSLRLLTPLQLAFGLGTSNMGLLFETSYFNAFTGLIIEYGFFGFSLFIIYCLFVAFRYESVARYTLMGVYLAAMFQGGYLFNLYGILIMAVIINMKGQYFHSMMNVQ